METRPGEEKKKLRTSCALPGSLAESAEEETLSTKKIILSNPPPPSLEKKPRCKSRLTMWLAKSHKGASYPAPFVQSPCPGAQLPS